MLKTNHVYQGKPFAITDAQIFRSDIIAYCVNTNESFELNLNLSSVMQFEDKLKELKALNDDFYESIHPFLAEASFKLDNAENIWKLDESKIHLPSNNVITQYFETKLSITFAFNVKLALHKESGIRTQHCELNPYKPIFSIEQKVFDCKGGRILKIGWTEDIDELYISCLDNFDTIIKSEVINDMFDSINVSPVIMSLIPKL